MKAIFLMLVLSIQNKVIEDEDGHQTSLFYKLPKRCQENLKYCRNIYRKVEMFVVYGEWPKHEKYQEERNRLHESRFLAKMEQEKVTDEKHTAEVHERKQDSKTQKKLIVLFESTVVILFRKILETLQNLSDSQKKEQMVLDYYQRILWLLHIKNDGELSFLWMRNHLKRMAGFIWKESVPVSDYQICTPYQNMNLKDGICRMIIKTMTALEFL